MSIFAPFGAPRESEEEDTYDPAHTLCHTCGRIYSGTDASGGHCMACHWSFRSESVGSAHRPYKLGRCLTPDEMRKKGWTCDESGTWRGAPPKSNPWKKSGEGQPT